MWIYITGLFTSNTDDIYEVKLHVCVGIIFLFSALLMSRQGEMRMKDICPSFVCIRTFKIPIIYSKDLFVT